MDNWPLTTSSQEFVKPTSTPLCTFAIKKREYSSEVILTNQVILTPLPFNRNLRTNPSPNGNQSHAQCNIPLALSEFANSRTLHRHLTYLHHRLRPSSHRQDHIVSICPEATGSGSQATVLNLGRTKMKMTRGWDHWLYRCVVSGEEIGGRIP
jgi:hypothetical protein